MKLIDKNGKLIARAIEDLATRFIKRYIGANIEEEKISQFKPKIVDSIQAAIGMGLVEYSEDLNSYMCEFRDVNITCAVTGDNFNIGDIEVKISNGLNTRRIQDGNIESYISLLHPHRSSSEALNLRSMCTGGVPCPIANPSTPFHKMVLIARSILFSYNPSGAYFGYNDVIGFIANYIKDTKELKEFYTSKYFKYALITSRRCYEHAYINPHRLIKELVYEFKKGEDGNPFNSNELSIIVNRIVFERLGVSRPEMIMKFIKPGTILDFESTVTKLSQAKSEVIESVTSWHMSSVQLLQEIRESIDSYNQSRTEAEKGMNSANFKAAIQEALDKLGVPEQNQVPFEEILGNRVVWPSLVSSDGENSERVSTEF